MIVMGNSEFSTGMKFAGVKRSFTVRNRAEALKILQNIPKDEFILANVSVIEMLPEFEEFPNVVSIPDKASDFGNIDDLRHIIKSVLGIELEVV